MRLAIGIAGQYYMESDTYVLTGVRYFTVNVDCGTPAFLCLPESIRYLTGRLRECKKIVVIKYK